MEVAGLVFGAIGFVDQAIKNGTTIAKVFRDSSTAGKQVLNTTQRLEAQRYTLDLWQRTWNSKAQQRAKATLEDGFRDLWGMDGYEMITKCLAQLSVKFGEASRALKSIDPDSFDGFTTLQVDSADKSRSTSPSQQLSAPTSGHSSQTSLELRKRWYRRLSPSDLKSLWKRKSLSESSSSNLVETPETKLQLAQEAVQQKLSPGTKFKWSILLKEQLRALINDIDDWLSLLQSLSTQCELERASTTLSGGQTTNPSSIRAAARALYNALQSNLSRHDVDFKLERERADSVYFERLFGRVEYIDTTDHSFKFPLLVSNSQNKSQPFLLLAEAIYPSTTAASALSLEKISTIEEIVDGIRDGVATTQDSPASLLFKSQHTVIVVHGISGSTRFSPIIQDSFTRCSFAELLRAEAKVAPLVACWKRLQLACVIAISVLHLYETGWISEHFETNDFHFFGSPNIQYDELRGIAPYVSASSSQADFSASPFDCLKKNQLPQSLLGARDVRLAGLFHRLGIVFFELGRGVQYREIFKEASPSESDVLLEIEKIPFGRPYRDLVSVCLTGSLYATSVMNLDRQFNTVVIEKLTRLEQHFSAILHGEL